MYTTKEYEQYLWGCRFCPMCKPASDSLNATLIESYATRAHAMTIWRVHSENGEYTQKQAELLYKCNLDGVAEAFCVDHYPVTAYMRAARRDLVEAGNLPAPVRAALGAAQEIQVEPKGDVLLFAEGAELDADRAFCKGKELAGRIDAGVAAGQTGYLAWALGADTTAKKQAEAMAKAITDSGAKTLVTTGAESLFTFAKLYPQLGVTLSAQVRPLAEVLFSEKAPVGLSGKKVFFHDPRAAFHLAETLPDEFVIMPDFFGPEEKLGRGAIYDHPREALARGGAEFTFMVWSRAMANAMGNDEGLALTYPVLAEKMARRRMAMVADTGAEVLVTDSLATVLYLESLPKDVLCGLALCYMGDL